MKRILVILSLFVFLVALGNGLNANIIAGDHEVCTVIDLDENAAVLVYCINVPEVSIIYNRVDLPDHLKQYAEPDLVNILKVPITVADIY